MQSINEWIEDFLQRHQWNAKQLAVAVGFDPSFITRLRDGTRRLSQDSVVEWNDRLDLTEEERVNLMVVTNTLLPEYRPVKKSDFGTMVVTARNLQLMGRRLEQMVDLTTGANGHLAVEKVEVGNQ